VYDPALKQVHLFERGHRKKKVHANVMALSDPDIPEIIGERLSLSITVTCLRQVCSICQTA
jgi:hypothetical protein